MNTPATVESFSLKYRPGSLEEIVGNTATVAKARGMEKRGSSKVILITGVTGTGKTTLGRIIANMLNGVAPGEPNPDLMEVNIGAEGRIDDIRRLIKVLPILPRRKYRIFLLDEVHKLTNDAKSTLLKPLEDAPAHVVWILCTDQPHKLFTTIQNRAEHFHLDVLSEEDLTVLLDRVCKAEKLDFGKKHKDILARIAELSAGTPRQSLQILQSAANLHAGGHGIENLEEYIVKEYSTYDVERAGIRYLVSMYARKPAKAIGCLNDVTNQSALLDSVLTLNRYLLQEVIGAQPYQNVWGIEFLKALQANLKTLPKASQVLKLHAALTDAAYKESQHTIQAYHFLVGAATTTMHSES